MKYSFLNSTYDGKTSTVTIGTKWGIFTGSTTRRPEDDEYNSQIFGGELAEMRAVIKACRARVKEIKSQLKILKLVDSNFRQISKIKFPNYTYKVIGNIVKNLDVEKISQIFSDAYSEGKNHVEIKCADGVVFREIYSYLIEEQNVFKYLSAGKDTVSYCEDEELLLLEIWLK